MFIHFHCLCSLGLTIKLNFNISKVAYCCIFRKCLLNRAAKSWAVSRSAFVLLKRAGIGLVVSCSAFGFFFVVLSVTNPKPPRMMSLSASYRPFVSSFLHIPPQEGFVKLANELFRQKMAADEKNVVWSKLGQNPSQMGARTFARIKNLLRLLRLKLSRGKL